MGEPDFYLSSSEITPLKGPHACWVEGEVKATGYEDFLLLRIDPAAIHYFTKKPLERILVAGRNKRLKNGTFPINVYVATIEDPKDITDNHFKEGSVKVVGDAELFKTYEEARHLAENR